MSRFRPVATKVHAATAIYFRLQAANKTLQEYIQRFTCLVIQATGTDPTLCQLSGDNQAIHETSI